MYSQDGGINQIEDYRHYDKLPSVVTQAIQTINRNNPLPLYQQLVQALKSVLEERKLEPGSFFATENLLLKVTKMSRATIRKALEELVRQGLLIRITGKGTFVSVTLPEDHIVLPDLKSLTEELKEKGMRPGTICLESKFIDPSERIAKELNVNNTVLFARRIRTGNDIPILYLCSYIPTHIGITPDMDLPDSLYKLLEQCGKQPSSAKHIIKATIIPRTIARHLGVEPLTAGLAMQRTTFDSSGTPILYEEGLFRGDLYSYTFRMQKHSLF